MLANKYGWSDDYIESLPAVTFFEYLMAVEVLESREMLRQFNAMDWPNRKDRDRARVYRDIYNMAYPKHLRPSKKISAEDIGRMLAKANINE